MDEQPEDCLLNLEARFAASLRSAAGLIDVAPVVLPIGRHLLGVNHHFGWPVATATRRGIVVVYNRAPCHWGCDVQPDEHSTDVAMVRSTDGGATWSEPVDMRRCINGPGRTSIEGAVWSHFIPGAGANPLGGRAGMRSICARPDGSIVLVARSGVFASRDGGFEWEHLPEAFTDRQLTGPICNSGPVILEHPRYGLLVLGHDVSSKRDPATHGRTPTELWLRWSNDDGRTWRETARDTGPDCAPCEPAGLLHDGMLVIVARNHAASAEDRQRGLWHYAQLVAEDGEPPGRVAATNIVASDANQRHVNTPVPKGFKLKPNMGAWTQDTVDVCFNPMTRRIEVVASDRNGEAGLGDANPRDCNSLGLWSIDPAALRAGSSVWRFECTLLRRRGLAHLEQTDGMHPGGAVLDPDRGVQHIFIYAGASRMGPSGIYRVTRTLDTPRLAAALR